MSDVAHLLLGEEDVPGATSSTDVDTLETVTACSSIARSEGRLRTFADDGYAVREITAETSAGESTVVVAVYEGISRSTREEMIFANLEQDVAGCSERPLGGLSGKLVEEMTPLGGLPESAVGYSSQITDNGTPEAVQRAYAIVGARVLVVGARHIGGNETGVDVLALLNAAIAKVEQAS